MSLSSKAELYSFKKMKINFYNLSFFRDLDEAFFQCELGKSLGFVRRCYICENYNQHNLEIPDCEESCWCRTSSSKFDVINHLIYKIFEAIQIREAESKEIFIISLELRKTSKEHLCVSYLVPFEPASIFIENPINIQCFTDYFQFTNESRLRRFGNCMTEF